MTSNVHGLLITEIDFFFGSEIRSSISNPSDFFEMLDHMKSCSISCPIDSPGETTNSIPLVAVTGSLSKSYLTDPDR